jgi:hypothetical protein
MQDIISLTLAFGTSESILITLRMVDVILSATY